MGCDATQYGEQEEVRTGSAVLVCGAWYLLGRKFGCVLRYYAVYMPDMW